MATRNFFSRFVTFRVDSVESVHEIFYKKHLVREECPLTPSTRTLFTLGWPPFTNKEEIKELYSSFGEVEEVYLKLQPGVIRDLQEVNNLDCESSFKVAYIVFQKEESLELTLKQRKSAKLSVEVGSSRLGVRKWCHEYMEQRIDVAKLKACADDFMHEFDKQESARKIATDKLREMDEDGWITVVRKGKKRLAGEGNSSHINDRKRRKKKNKKELLNFYAFQQRESRRDHIAKLRKKFEEDKSKVLAMKQARKFKPF